MNEPVVNVSQYDDFKSHPKEIGKKRSDNSIIVSAPSSKKDNLTSISELDYQKTRDKLNLNT